jgi:HK97 family phage prohead protease
MEHKTATATATITDQNLGQFVALVSAWQADREKDVISRTAFDTTIEAWQRSGKKLPLLFEHSQIVVGAVDPHSRHATAAGLVVAGEVDRSTDEGRQVWRSIKSGVLGFSIGFMSESRPRPGGGRELTEIDLLEVSATSTPMHPATRALSWKAATADAETPSDADQKARLARLMFSAEHEADVARWIKTLNAALAETQASKPRVKSTRPITVKTFEC